jgi:hypothetical protein
MEYWNTGVMEWWGKRPQRFSQTFEVFEELVKN